MAVRIISAKVWVALHQVMLVMPKHLGLGQSQCPGSLHSSSKAFFHRSAKHETFGVYTCSAYAAYACIRMYSHVFAFGFPWEYMYTPPFSSGIQGAYAVYACIRMYSLLGFPSVLLFGCFLCFDVPGHIWYRFVRERCGQRPRQASVKLARQGGAQFASLQLLNTSSTHCLLGPKCGMTCCHRVAQLGRIS